MRVALVCWVFYLLLYCASSSFAIAGDTITADLVLLNNTSIAIKLSGINVITTCGRAPIELASNLLLNPSQTLRFEVPITLPSKLASRRGSLQKVRKKCVALWLASLTVLATSHPSLLNNSISLKKKLPPSSPPSPCLVPDWTWRSQEN